MASNDHKEEYNVLGDIVRKGTLDTLSAEQLKNYHTLLANNGAGEWSEAFYWRLCDEIKTLIYQKEKEESDTKRHHEIQIKLEELKKTHWTVNPNFWFTFIAAIAGVVGCILTWNSSQEQSIEAQKSYELNKKSLEASKDTSQKVAENVNIMKETQRSNLVLISQSAGVTNTRYNLSIKRQSDTLMTSLPNAVSYNFKNVGNVPVKHINIKKACIGYTDELTSKAKCPPAVVETEQNEQGIIGPGENVSVELRLTKDVDDVYATYQLQDNGKVCLLSKISIEYIDHLTKRELSFCKVMQKGQWRDCSSIRQ